MSLAFAAACFYAAALVFSAIAAAYGFYPRWTDPAVAVSAVGLVAPVVWLHLGGRDDPDE